MSTPREFFKPITGSVMPRFAGLATLMRLPYVQKTDAEFADVEIGLVGIPWDGGTTNRPGARHGPRQVRDISTMIRNVNRASGNTALVGATMMFEILCVLADSIKARKA